MRFLKNAVVIWIVFSIAFSPLLESAAKAEDGENSGKPGKPKTPQIEKLSQETEEEIARSREQDRHVIDITDVKHHTVTMTSNMAKFYLAVGVMDAWECFRKNDPSICREYVKGLTDPVNQTGFVLFALSSQQFGRGVMLLGGGRLAANYMGLGVGMFVQDFFSDIMESPNAIAYRKTWSMPDSPYRKALRKKLLNALWQNTIASGGWWLDKVPDLVGLVGAAALSSYKLKAAEASLDFAERYLHVAANGRTARILLKARNGLKFYEAAATGVKIVWSGARIVQVSSVVGIGASVVETIIFMNFDKWITDPVRWAWDGISEQVRFNKASANLEIAARQHQSQENIRRLAQELATIWEASRADRMREAQAIQSRNAVELNDWNEELAKIVKAYFWATGGIDSKSGKTIAPMDMSLLRTDDPLEWKKLIIMPDYFLEQLFCGVRPEDAIHPEKILMGIPYTPESSIDLFRIADVKATCKYAEIQNYSEQGAKEICRQLGSDCKIGPDGQFQTRTGRVQPWVLYIRYNRLMAIRDPRIQKYADQAIQRLMTSAKGVSQEIVNRYDSVVQESLVKAMTGFSVQEIKSAQWLDQKIAAVAKTSNDSAGVAILPSYEREIALWQSMIKAYPEYSSAFSELLEATEKEQKVSKEVLEYAIQPVGNRMLPEDMDPLYALLDNAGSESFDSSAEQSSPPWKNAIKMWRSFVIQSQGQGQEL